MDEEIDEESIITVMRLMQFQNLLKPEKIQACQASHPNLWDPVRPLTNWTR